MIRQVQERYSWLTYGWHPVIDDLLPEELDGTLACAGTRHNDHLWPSLVEKAVRIPLTRYRVSFAHTQASISSSMEATTLLDRECSPKPETDLHRLSTFAETLLLIYSKS